MKKSEKMETFNYYLHAEVCVCGAPKQKVHWCCESCKIKHWRSSQALELHEACTCHVLMARDFLKLCAPLAPADTALPST